MSRSSVVACCGLACSWLVSAWGVTAHAQASGAGRDPAVQGWFDASQERWIGLYRGLHAKPELSRQERETAALVARELQSAGYQVTTGVGGFGVVGLLQNGVGKTLLLRGDMDALPVLEQTELPFRSRVQALDASGQSVSVMHACGHDIHITNLLASAAYLAEHRSEWSGTLVVIAQPAEEIGEGASAMIAAGLFKRFPRPDYAIALHVDADLPAGKVAANPAWAAANVDSVDLTILGRGGHGARPQDASDPIVTAAHFVTALQTLVSRRNDPQQPAVITVGSIHGGTKHNVIPDSVHLQLTVRSYSDAVRAQLLADIEQLARDLCKAFECPKPPKLEVKEKHTPAVYNDPNLTATASKLFQQVLGEHALGQLPPTMGGEDFGVYGKTLSVPSLLYRLGATPAAVHRASHRPGAAPVPGLHSSRFAPDAPLTLRTGVRSMVGLVLALLPASR
jgi:amidohydrolase